jgi:phosphoserine aminotransferase
MKEGALPILNLAKRGAIKEAKFFVNCRCCFIKRKLQNIPKGYVPADANYFHCTSNNTILVLK